MARFLGVICPITMMGVFLLTIAGLLQPIWMIVDLVVLLVISAGSTAVAIWLRPR